MISGNLLNNLKKTGFVLTLAFSFLILSGVTTNAQWRNNDNGRRDRREDRRDDRRDRQRERRDDYRRNDNRQSRDDYRNIYGSGIGYGYNVARQEGYRDGLRAGADDARDRERYNPQKHSDFKKATDGYQRSYGDKGQYRQVYRDAFVQGYREGYSRYGYENNRNRNNGRWGW